MYLTAETIGRIEQIYGTPEVISSRFEMNPNEFEGLKASQKHGRSHDVTLFIRKDDQYIVNAKHFYPKGLYRAPSGGINPDEDFVRGATREALEETGCQIELVRYILRSEVEFYSESETVAWTSYVFLADYLSGDLIPQDTREIREVSLADIDSFTHFRKMMLASDKGGFHYRAFLQDKVLDILNSRNFE